jgi:hypothetical protein
MRIFEVIGPCIDEGPPAKPMPSRPRSDVARQNQALPALLYQTLTRDGWVIAPGIIGNNFEWSHERSEIDDNWTGETEYQLYGWR